MSDENISVVSAIRGELDRKEARHSALEAEDYTAASRISSHQPAPPSEHGPQPDAMNESVIEGVRALMDEDKSGRHAKSDDADDDGPDEGPIKSRDKGVERIKQRAEKRSEPKAPPPRAVEADSEPSYTAQDVQAITFLKTGEAQVRQAAQAFDNALRQAQQLRDPAQRAQAEKLLLAERARIQGAAKQLADVRANASSAFQARQLARHQQKLETGRQQLRKEFKDFDPAKTRAFALAEGFSEQEVDTIADVRTVRMLERARRASLPKPRVIQRSGKPKPRVDVMSAKGVTNAVRQAMDTQQRHKRWMAKHGL